MYAVSNEYRTAMLSPVQEHDLKGTIGDTAFAADDVLAGSFSLTNRAMEPTNITYGSVYVGELTMTVSNAFPIARGSWRGKQIIPQVGLKVGDSFEYVPLGIFTIDEAKWSLAGIALTAYDNMVLFDREFPGVDIYNNMTPFGFLTAACEACHVSFAMTQAEVEAMPNGVRQLWIHLEHDIETWRDLISWIAQVLGGFATINRAGALEIRRFGTATGLSFDATERFSGAVMEDFITHYTGVGLEMIDQNEYHYVTQQVDDGETVKLGANPLLQNYLPVEIDARLRMILDELATLAYTPFKATMLGDVALDLGDVITYTDGIAASGGDDCCIMAFSYKHGRGCSFEGYGDNPALATARSKVDKNLSGILSQVDSKEIKYYQFINAQDFEIGDEETEQVINIRATAAVDGLAIFQAELSMEADADLDCVVTYVKDGHTVIYSPKQTIKQGRHIMSLLYPIPVEANELCDWRVYLTADGGTLTIDAGDIHAILSGQALAAADTWDGRIEIDQDVPTIPMPLIDIDGISDTVGLDLTDPHWITISEEVGSVAVGMIAVDRTGLAERVTFLMQTLVFGRVTEAGDQRVTEDGNRRITEEED